LRGHLESRTRGVPVVITCTSATLALGALGIRRFALINPPWFSPEVNRLCAEYFRSQGFEVVHASPADLPRDQRAVHPGQLYEWVRAHTPDAAEAVLIGRNGLRAVGLIRALEEKLGRPVITANQVAFWHALRLSGTRAPVTG
jgi:maleate isomerase